MFFGNADIEATLRKALFKARKAGSAHHRSRDCANARLLLRKCAECAAEGVGKRGQVARKLGMSIRRVKAADAMKNIGIQLCRAVASALLRDDMQEHRALTILDQAQHVFQPSEVVAVHGAIVFKAHFLKQRAAQQHALPALFEAVRHAIDRLATR